MPDADSLTIACDFCGAKLLVRRDQLGRRIRCGKCRYAFTVSLQHPSASAPPQAAPEPPEPAADADAQALVSPPVPPRTWPRAKISARFERPAVLLLEACAQALRGCNCDLLDVDRGNLRIKFAFAVAGQGSDHMCNLFHSGERWSEMEMISWGPNVENQFDVYYATIIREVSKYLMFAVPPAPTPHAEPDAPRPPERDRSEERPRSRRRRDEDDDRANDDEDEDDWRNIESRRRPLALEDRRDDGYRRGSASTVQGFGIAALVCGIIGVVCSCVPILGGVLGALGILFGGASYNNTPHSRPKNGLATAGLVLGIIACALALIVFLLIVSRAHHSHYYYW